MSSRERLLLLALAVVLVGGGGAVFAWSSFVQPLLEANRTINRLQRETEQLDAEVELMLIEKKKLADARQRSLSSNAALAAAEYTQFLQPLLISQGLVVEDFKGPSTDLRTAASKKPEHRILTFQVQAKGELPALVRTLDVIQHTPLLHRVRSLSINRVDTTTPVGGSSKLNIAMTIEAMIVVGAPPKSAVPLDTLASLVRPGAYDYGELGKRNLFLGELPPPPPPKEEKPPEPDPEPVPEPEPEGPVVTEFVRLVMTSPSSDEAFLRNFLQKSGEIRLRSTPMSGYDTFRIMDEGMKKVLVRGRVLRIDQRDVYIQVGDNVYAVHVGQTLSDAMRRRIPDADLDRLELTDLFDEDWATQEKEKEKKPAKTSKKSR